MGTTTITKEEVKRREEERNKLLEKYNSRSNGKNLKLCIDSLFNYSMSNIERICFYLLDEVKTCNCNNIGIWNNNELIVFRTLLHHNGVLTISEISKISQMEIHKVRDAVRGLEEEETNPLPVVMSIKWYGNSKLVFLSPYYLNYLLNKNKNGNRE